MEADAHPVPGEPLPVPDTLTSLVLRRLDRLPVRARGTLLFVAALSAPTVELVRRAVGTTDADAAIARAEQAGMIQVRDDHIYFAHPLLARGRARTTHEPEDGRSQLRIYDKLGIRSRAELGARMAERRGRSRD
jgi:hypothetical protein